jgi:hypothetical protein
MIAVRFMAVALGFSAALNVLPAWRRGEWSVVLDSIAMVLLGLVIWFAIERDAEQLRPPTFGTRALRLTLYATILMLFVVSGSGRQFVGDTWGCGNVTMAIFAAVVLTPFVRSELEARKHEAVS